MTRYPLNQSPFFKLRSRSKLAELLRVSATKLDEMASAQESLDVIEPNKTTSPQNALYNCFLKKIVKNGETKERRIERPMAELRRVQQRIVELLDRIEPPNYLHSGIKGRSYISNASLHDLNQRTAKIDIKKFFSSAYAGYVFRSFQDLFKCSPDVAAVLMRLTTAFGHIPTGGNSSTLISYFAFKPMFDEIQVLAVSRGVVMSICVDDMTFSGAKATEGFLNDVRMIVNRFGLKTHKRHCFEARQPKVVTGVALTSRGMRLPNVRRKKLHEVSKAFAGESNPTERVRLGEQLLGRTSEAAQIEPQFSPLVRTAASRLAEAKAALRKSPRGIRTD